MSAASGEGTFWALIGKVAVVISAVVGVVTLITTCSAPAPGLHADIERGHFVLPPRYSQFHDAVVAAVKSESIEALIGPALQASHIKVNDLDLHVIANDVGLALRNRLIDPRMDSSLSAPSNYWDASVSNTGGVELASVAIRIPGASLGVIEREDGSTLTDTKGPVFEIGALSVGEKVKVTAWSERYTLYFTDAPTVYFSGGQGSISIADEPTVWELLKTHALELLFLLFALGFMILPLIYGHLSKRHWPARTALG
ncbi:MAG: hypothetical protein GAK28_04852 [Luteibacter sp.]|uniref:hypothetical protein n=1 Tax=Luteibacter sp. TaxID=1886636 RepID=UPI00137D4793|nr:hypothetical protein [Luteibacter sp.]KAF1003244.1 MAG: hypothetical protein GAK28_04852 [Luteibacter sp.]